MLYALEKEIEQCKKDYNLSGDQDSYVIWGLTKWLGETGFPEIAPLVFAEITEKFGLSQETTEAILRDVL
jgi:hypothetical protein